MVAGGLLTYAKRIALSPATTAWNTIQTDIYQKNVQHHTEEVAAKRGVAEPRVAVAEMQDIAGTICDLTAYSMMVIAGGIARYNALKRLAAEGGIGAVGQTGDRVERFKPGADVACLTSLLSWAFQPHHGALQIKYANQDGDWHTFVIERFVAEDGGLPRYRLYQSYQQTYTLATFLALTGAEPFLQRYPDFDNKNAYYYAVKPAKKFGLELSHHHPPSRTAQLNEGVEYEDVLEYWYELTAKRQMTLATQISAVQRAVSTVGEGKVLSQATLANRVLTPLARLLGGGLDAGSYSSITGSAVTKRFQASAIMIIRMDKTVPTQFQSNSHNLNAGEHTSGFIGE